MTDESMASGTADTGPRDPGEPGPGNPGDESLLARWREIATF